MDVVKSVTVIVIGVIVLVLNRVFGEDLANRLKNICGKFPSSVDVVKDRKINNSLIELRALTNCDRAFLLRFHNGDEFSPADDVWKLTCTHEVVRPGVTYEMIDIHGVVFSKMSKIVGPVLTGESLDSGIGLCDLCRTCDSVDVCMRFNKHLVCGLVSLMDDSFEKHQLQQQNVWGFAACGLARNGCVFGVLGMHFCGAEPHDADICAKVKELCLAANSIQHILA